jgi:hypothetical protein
LLHQHLRRWQLLLLLLLLLVCGCRGVCRRRIVFAVHDQQQELIAGDVAGDEVLLVAWRDQDGRFQQARDKLCSRKRNSRLHR